MSSLEVYLPDMTSSLRAGDLKTKELMRRKGILFKNISYF